MFSSILKLASTLTLYLSNSDYIGTDYKKEADENLFFIDKVLRGICSYEAVKKIPPPVDYMDYDRCMYYANMPERKYAANITDDYDWDDVDHLYDALLGSITNYSKEYYNCTDYLGYLTEKLDRPFYKFLNDPEVYRYDNLVHCFLHALEEIHGSKAIIDVHSHWNEPTNFLMGMWNRENELRAHHGAPGLLLDDELTKQVQLIAEDMAAAGKDYISSKHQKSQFQVDEDNFEPVGESADQCEWTRGIPVNVDMLGAVIANKWFSEREQYPWPAFDGTNGDPKSFAKFTQQVWKGTKCVGYGYVVTGGLPEGVQVVARYWPAGNPADEAFLHLYKENVLPVDLIYSLFL